MFNKYDYKYVIKKILIGVGILFIMGFIRSCEVKAEVNVIDRESGVYETSSTAVFYNNTNGTFVESTTVADNESGSYWTNDTVTSNGYGEGIAFDLNNALKKDVTYSLTIYLASDYNNYYYYYKNSVTYPRLISCGNYYWNAVSDFNSGNGILADYERFSIGSTKIQMYVLDGNPVYRYGNFLTYVFKANSNCGSVFIPFNANNTTTHYTGFMGYSIEALGNTNQLSANDMNTILANSGLATANDINSLRTAITQMQSSISSSISAQSQQQHADHQETINTITSDDTTGAESSVDSLLQNNAFSDSSGVNAIISLPLNFIQSLTSKRCQSLLLNIPYMNEVANIPCMQNYIHTNAPTLYLIIKTIVNGYVIYRVLLDILSLVKSARNPDDDRIEVLDL